MNLPNCDQCFQLLLKLEVMDHIIEHCQRVASVAVYLARELISAGIFLNVPLVEAAGLLHDISKMESLRTGVDHAQAGEMLLEQLGYREVADIVGQHVRLRDPSVPFITEAAVVNYSDKRVLHTSIVSITERFVYIREKYGHDNPARLVRIKATEEETRRIEERIFARLAISPKDINLMPG